MGPQKVVMGDEESGHSDGAVGFFEAVTRADVVFIGSIQPFDELLKRAVFFRFGVKILESDHFMMGYFMAFVPQLVKEVYPRRIGGVAVGGKGEFLLRRCGSNSLLHSDDSRQGFPVVSNMICSDL